MSIESNLLIATTIGGLVLLVTGVVIGWLAARPALARMQSRLDAVQDTETSLRDTFRDTFRALSDEALKSNNQAFLDLAETRLRDARTSAAKDIDERKAAIENLLAPMAKTLGDVDRELREGERRRLQTDAQLLQRIISLDTAGQDLRQQTGRLVDALKRPGVRGRWGELQLKRVVELAGMIEHCDFIEQHTVSNGDGDRRMRPDVIVRLPGGKHVVVDAKAPLDAYLRALDAQDEPSRQALMCEHSKQVRNHISQLASKGYAAHIQPGPDFVVMFLPGEMFFSAALEHDPELIEFGVEQHVVPASPTTLIALLRAVAYGWQQQAMEENARKISDLGRQLYDAVRVLGGHFDDLGTRLKSTLDAYNKAVGSLEGNVLVKARKFKDLQAANATEDIVELEPVDRVPRMLQAPELTDGLPFHVSEDVEVERA
ncbi:MAG TPA: DNA recombination protein RmuC [Vicinamibacterales bacterium]|nr:DNA recombination protein RmuC [Vicinamibacterales bacterium]